MVLATSGLPRVAHQEHGRGTGRNVGNAERWASIAGGAALALLGARRRGGSGVAMAVLGAELIRRGATGHCMVYEAVGYSTTEDDVANDARSGGEMREVHAGTAGTTGGSPSSRTDVTGARATVNARKAVKIERSVVVQRSAAELYRYWRDPRNMPEVMQLVDAVEPIDDTHARWFATAPGGRRIEWVAEIINDLPNELIAWKSADDADVANAGSVHFRQAPGGGTEVRLVMDYEPPFGRAGYVLARLLRRDPDVMLQEDLARFKVAMESGQDRA
jgi:uncharacterized membrane protein